MGNRDKRSREKKKPKKKEIKPLSMPARPAVEIQTSCTATTTANGRGTS